MKILVLLFLGGLAVCSSNPLREIPKDNSHYVEGESRYIWMPDGDGEIHLVDLHAPVEEDENSRAARNGANNAYWLFTRNNRVNHQLLVMNDEASIRNSRYSRTLPTKVIVHGWNGKGGSALNPLITAAFLDNSNCNVIVVDWNRAATGTYGTVVNAVPSIGQHLANFLQFVIDTVGGSWNNMHLVGHSLGAHVVGIAGRAARTLPARVTGLDPAGPQWRGNQNALRRNSGQYVEAIHTDGMILGIWDALCHSDFYPDSGRNPQPGCSGSPCSHSRAYLLFASSVRTNHFIGRRCNNLNQALNMECTGDTLRMGNAILSKTGSGNFGLRTLRDFPY